VITGNMSIQCMRFLGGRFHSLPSSGSRYTKFIQDQVRLASTSGRSDNAAATADVMTQDTPTSPPTNDAVSPRVKRMLERRNYRFAFPEFLPDPDPLYRNSLCEFLSRKDMLKRREKVDIPEFYVGSIVSVTMSDPNAANESKTSTFTGIVIDRGGSRLRAWFVVRNVVDHQGVEIMYQMYSPNIQRIETLKLERRLDDELYYLRDAAPEHSKVPLDMEPELLAEGQRVPLNEQVVPLREQPWSRRWEKYAGLLRGFSFDINDKAAIHDSTRERFRKQNLYLNTGWQRETRKYDLMLHYRETIPVDQQDAIWEEVGDQLEARDRDIKRAAIKRSLVKSGKKS